ncbi:hypothetical protein ABT075_14130 [Streptomyces sp. NPDC002677]|uniref:hypothetical protein n=1 Tax=Streptomyces sp. NPDC002677 TaxID=3154774 RepID=UPI003327C507
MRATLDQDHEPQRRVAELHTTAADTVTTATGILPPTKLAELVGTIRRGGQQPGRRVAEG